MELQCKTPFLFPTTARNSLPTPAYTTKKPGQNIRRKKARILVAVHTYSWKRSLDFFCSFLPLHCSQRCCLAMFSDDDIAHLLNPGAADSRAFKSNSEYFASRMLTRKLHDEEDADRKANNSLLLNYCL